jgi:hypothetical protein
VCDRRHSGSCSRSWGHPSTHRREPHNVGLRPVKPSAPRYLTDAKPYPRRMPRTGEIRHRTRSLDSQFRAQGEPSHVALPRKLTPHAFLSRFDMDIDRWA